MAKAPDAFRTISEVADWLDTPTHVLRFWESKFSQIKPIKRAGGRRYYRPEDMELLGGIKSLLHEQGMTIKGVQKLLREQGAKHVAALGPGLDDAPAPLDDVYDTVAVQNEPAFVSPPTPRHVPSVEAVNVKAEPAQPDFSAVLAALPKTMPAPTVGRPRLLAALHRADDKSVARNASRIRPLLRQMQDLRARMGRD